MDIEFHYYLTYLIAVRAGWNPMEAAIIAHASQGVDDNHIPIEVDAGGANAYRSQISQTMDITNPHEDRQIYPAFHFVPGDPEAPTARRKDGRKDRWVTTPDGAIARRMIEAALSTGDLYRIGIASHVYVDTWAHQNFLGRRDSFNGLPPADDTDKELEQAVMDVAIDVGHGAAKHQPDIPALVWTDGRLASSTVDNRARFLDAAEALYRRYAGVRGLESERIGADVVALRNDVAADIGEPTHMASAEDPERIARYRSRAEQAAYGGQPIPDYDPAAWFNQALAQDRNDVLATWREKIVGLAGDYSDLIRRDERVPCLWRDAADRMSTSWYHFQEAVKAHLTECWAALDRADIHPTC